MIEGVDRMGRARRILAIVAVSLWMAPTGAAAGEPTFVLDYRPPLLSLEARGVPLREVLAGVGKAVGFQVVAGDAASSTVDVLIRDASLDDVLRRLLRGENHTLLYRPGEVKGDPPALDRVVLLGASQTGALEVAPVGPSTGGTQQEARAPGAIPGLAAGPAQFPAAVGGVPDVSPLLSWGREALEDEQREVTLSDVLQAHAMAAIQAAQAGAADPAVVGPASPAPRDVRADLAETTRRAQEGLAALVDGLAAATRSLQESAAARPK